jgi:hypothetical protein
MFWFVPSNRPARQLSVPTQKRETSESETIQHVDINV